MNIFDSVQNLKAKADSKKRGKVTVSPDRIKLPYFTGNMKRKVEGKQTLTSAFIMSYMTAYTFCRLQLENEAIQAANKGKKKADCKPLIPFSVYAVEYFLNEQGFTYAHYSQSGRSGHKAVAYHLEACAAKKGLESLSIDDEGIISGITPEIASSVLQAV